jgi:hypothetical protein
VKNKNGLHRSPEFLKAHPEQKAGEPKLDHMRVHMADENGEVKVTHHAGPNTAPMATHHVKGEELAEHVMEHSGAAYGSEGGGEHYADEGEEVEK